MGEVEAQAATPHDKTARHWINGAWRTGRLGASCSPSTGAVLGRFAAGGAEEALGGISAARAAFEETNWSRDRNLRFRALSELAERIEERRDALIRTLALENGKILAEATFEVDATAPLLRYYAGLLLSDAGAASEVAPGQFFQSLREPNGRINSAVG